MTYKGLLRWWQRLGRRKCPQDITTLEKETYLRLIGYIQELMKGYKEMMEFLLERLRGRKEYWQGHTAGLRVKTPDKDTLIELQIAQGRLEELAQFLDWLETASNKLNQEIIKVSDKLEEEIRRQFPKS